MYSLTANLSRPLVDAKHSLTQKYSPLKAFQHLGTSSAREIVRFDIGVFTLPKFEFMG